MFEFMNRHIKLILGIAIAIIIALVVILIYVSGEAPQATDSNVNNEAQYEFLNSNISEQDKYVMLLAKIQVENFGTNPAFDPRPLWDLKNQSTEQFGSIVDDLLNDQSTTVEITTIVNPDSISIQNSDETSVELKMNAAQTIGSQTRQLQFGVSMVKQDGYWLVDNIIQL